MRGTTLPGRTFPAADRWTASPLAAGEPVAALYARTSNGGWAFPEVPVRLGRPLEDEPQRSSQRWHRCRWNERTVRLLETDEDLREAAERSRAFQRQGQHREQGKR
jgi:hypothetical protein